MPNILSNKTVNSKEKRDHLLNQKIICCCCLKKCLKCIPVTKLLEAYIRMYVKPEYSISVYSYPTGICPTCKKYVNLLKESKDIPNAVKTRSQSSQLSRCVSTRNCETCTVCSIARSRFPHMKKTKKLVSSNRMCNVCLCAIKRGIRHQCNEMNVYTNLSAKLFNASKKVQKKVTLNVLRSIIKKKKLKHGIQTHLNTGGLPLPITIGVPQLVIRKVKFEETEKMIIRLGLSQFKSRILLKSLRKSGIQFEANLKKNFAKKVNSYLNFMM
ncbi:uncharacterized protein LOC136091646 [Hydra vulgaris]|uniref:Uncharacterized protein LOC136091646 n=1 Tax=Hydra vulgaris TaxID=6087 RepID=A0ABM4DLK3_HYDVU